MNITLLASEIASKIPEMSRDSQINNADLIQNLIRQEMERGECREVVEWIDSKENLFFAECTQAGEMIIRCRKALTNNP